MLTIGPDGRLGSDCVTVRAQPVSAIVWVDSEVRLDHGGVVLLLLWGGGGFGE